MILFIFIYLVVAFLTSLGVIENYKLVKENNTNSDTLFCIAFGIGMAWPCSFTVLIFIVIFKILIGLYRLIFKKL
jgi:hypothetical protein